MLNLISLGFSALNYSDVLMPTNAHPDPLTENTSRQAVDSIRGYGYQLWHSVFAWLSLAEDEALFLEGAEDFDRITKNSATTTQVKSSPQNITLRHKDVIAAITHYWQLHLAKKDKNISFRFLTRGQIGIEKGNPFGSGTAGLTLWEQCKRNPRMIDTLKTFLINENKVSAEVSGFLSSADNEEIQGELIRKIDWVTGMGDTEYLESSVKDFLTNHGDKYAIHAEDSQMVAPRLYVEASEVASRKIGDRWLTKTLFIELFSQETSVRISKSAVSNLLSPRKPEMDAISPILNPSPIYSLDVSDSPLSLPHLPANFCKRESMVADLTTKLKHLGMISLYGSAGVGKSTLATMICEKLGGEWVWINYSGLTGQQLKIQLHQSLLHCYAKNEINIVLDDIALHEASLLAFDLELKIILHYISQKHGHAIITSQRPMTQTILGFLSLTGEMNCAIKPFDEDDVISLSMNFRCPTKAAAKVWAMVILTRTRGHPQLVHAYVTYLARIKWKKTDLEKLFDLPEDVQDVRKSALPVLELLGEKEKTLAYRLSLLVGLFRRDHAVRIGEIEPSVMNAGTIFDGIVGPWIEPVSNDYFQISPLLATAAENAWSPQLVTEMHADIAEAILHSGRLTLREASATLMHAFSGKNIPALLSVIYSLTNSSEDEFQQVATHFDWLVVWGTNPAQPIYQDDMTVNHVFRSFQFRIASITNPTLATQLAEIWAKELESDESDINVLLMRVVHYSQILIRTDVRLPMKFLLECLGTIWSIEHQLASETDLALEYKRLFPDEDHPINAELLDFLPWTVLSRCRSKKNLSRLLDAISAWDDNHRERLSVHLTNHDQEADQLITQSWMDESKSDQPDWPSCIEIFTRTIDLALSWDLLVLAQSAIRGIGIIQQEFLGDNDSALAMLERYIDELGESVTLLDAKATILFNTGSYSAALLIWDEILPEWFRSEIAEDIGPMFSARYAGIACDRTGDFHRSAYYFALAHNRSLRLHHPTYFLGLLADLGCAFWRAERYSLALKTISDVLEGAESCGLEQENPNVFIIMKLVGNMILWINKTVKNEDRKDFAEPSPGMFSHPEPDPRIQNLPPTPLDISWGLLAECEHELTLETIIYDLALSRLTESSPPYLRMILARLGVGKVFRQNQFAELPNAAQNVDVSAQALHDAQEAGLSAVTTSPYETNIALGSVVGYDAFLGALLALVSLGKSPRKMLDIWHHESASNASHAKFLNWIEGMIQIDQMPEAEQIQILRDDVANRDNRYFAGIKIVSGSNRQPDLIMFSHLHLFDLSIRSLLNLHRIDIGGELSALIAHQWLEILKMPALLNSPTRTMPQIESACNNKEEGFSKAASILESAIPATSIRLPASWQALVDSIAPNAI